MNPDLSLAAQRGWKLFPLAHSSRLALLQPLMPDATSNEAQIEQWEHQYPECRWAVATGRESGVFAIKFSLDEGLASMREFGEHDPGISLTLQMRTPNELLVFLQWPATGFPLFTCSAIAAGAHLLEDESYAPIPGPGMQSRFHCRYADGTAPVLPASEWLMERLHQGNGRSEGGQILAFPPPPSDARRVLLRFERKGIRWFCDFYEASGVARIRETLIYRSSETIVSLATRGGAIAKYGSQVPLYSGIEVGHGTVVLNLTTEQYQKLIAA